MVSVIQRAEMTTGSKKINNPLRMSGRTGIKSDYEH
jgi:hypothetical protein